MTLMDITKSLIIQASFQYIGVRLGDWKKLPYLEGILLSVVYCSFATTARGRGEKEKMAREKSLDGNRGGQERGRNEEDGFLRSVNARHPATLSLSLSHEVFFALFQMFIQ